MQAKPKQSMIARPLTDQEMNKILQLTSLDRNDINQIYIKFCKIQNNFTIQKYEIVDILKEMSMNIDEKFNQKLNSELAEKELTKQLDFQQLCQIFSTMKQFIDQEESNSMNAEYLDAFVALGGNYDQTGSVSKDYILSVLREEFELEIDLDFLIDKYGNSSNDLSFEEFVHLFETAIDDSKSRASFVSAFSQRAGVQKQNKSGTFHVRQKDFDKWCEVYDKNTNNK